MAIQPNRRKRRHEETTAEQEDDGEVEVPKKLAKESDTPKKKKKKDKTEKSIDESKLEITETNPADSTPSKKKSKKSKTSDTSVEQQVEAEMYEDEDEISRDSGIEPEESHIHFPNDFKMMHFRTKLRGNNFITELRHFLHMCSTTRPKLAAKYIEKRGKPLELAEAFERIDKTNLLHVDYLTEALHRVLMEILTNQKSHMESAVHGCRYFLKVHGGVLENQMKSTQLGHRRNALKLLTAIVCVEPQLARQVLNSYDVLSNVTVTQKLLSHEKSEYQCEDTVRKAFIHFILAFLVEGNTLLIRNILDRGQLIGVLAKGLVYDDHVTVCVVLNALRQYVLENPEIQKTKKVLVFDLECCKNMRRLYDWEGPMGLKVMFAKSKHASMMPPNPQEAEAVSAAVHELLLVLLTSRKHGICFDAMTHYRQKQNKLQGRLLGSLFKPYDNPRKVDLVIKTLTACPDLGRNTVRNCSSLLSPVKTKSTDLPKAVMFLAQIINAVPPSALSSAFDKMTLTDFSFWIKELCLPIEALLHITGKKYLSDPDFNLRLAVLRLLLSMMKQYSNYMHAIAVREQSKKAGNSLRKFKFDLLNHLLVHFPTIESILYSLYVFIKQKNLEGVNVLESLSITLDLVMLLCKENRAFVNKTSQILDYLDVLRPLYETDFDKLNQPEELLKIQLELKSIKTILLLFPHSLNPTQPLFGNVFKSFIKAYMLEEKSIKSESGNILNRLFQNTGMFDSCRHEINIWIEALIGFGPATVTNVVEILLTILCLDWRQIELPEQSIADTAIITKNLSKLFAQIEQGQTVQAYVETLTLSKMMPLLLKGVELEEPYDEYVELVFVLLFHYHSKPEIVLQIYEDNLSKHTNYMKSWLPGEGNGKPKKLPHLIFDKWPLLKQMRKVSTESETMPFEQVFKVDDMENKFELQLEEGQTMLLHSSLGNPRRNMIYIQDLLFVFSHFFTSEKLSKPQAELTADFLIKFLQIASQVDGPEEVEESEDEQQDENFTQSMLHYIFTHRLWQLHPTELLSETSESRLNYVIFLRRLVEHCRSLPRFETYTANYRLHLIKTLDIALDTPADQLGNQQQLDECVKLVDSFEFNSDQCSQMLDLLTTKAQAKDCIPNGKPNHYFDLLIRLLGRMNTLKEPIDCGKSIKLILTFYKDFGELNEQQLEPLELAVLEFLLNYHHHMDECDSEFFACFFTSSRKLSKSAIRLACLLLERQPRLAEKFAELLPSNLEQKDLVYPLLDIALTKNYQIPLPVLQRCYQTYKNGFMKSIEKPQKAALIYRENSEASALLIALCMPKSECFDYCQKQLKLDSVELFQVRVLREIYWQGFAAAKDEKQKATVFVNYINLNVQLLALDLKKQALDLPKLEQISWNCYEWWKTNRTDDLPLDWSRLQKNPQWLNFCKSSLKLALHLGEERLPLQDETNGLVLKLMGLPV
ncbi:GM23649 [Drosophila sechellia]|uniref:GM23649 n=1 Tax=Drosophila sechellia TaxID=7238 RepID=B4HE89_DROSE|nr:GM23649 [Drosophila sechellia]